MRLILHAGTHKTGTTSLQRFAHDNRAVLRARGLQYLDGPPAQADRPGIWRSHNWLAQGVTLDDPERRAAIRDALDAARLHADPGGTILISAEDLSACCKAHPLWGGLPRADFRDLQRAYLRDVAEVLSGFEIEVLLVFRRADEYVESLFKTLIKSNRYIGSFEEFLAYCAPLCDYAGQVAAFRAVFARVRVKSYHQLGANAVGGILQEIGFPVTDPPDLRRNIALDARLIYWKATRDAGCRQDPQRRALHRRFLLSPEAGALFAGAGPASFWRSAEDRAAFHARAAHGISDLVFPGPKDCTAADARLSASGLHTVDHAFHAWVPSRKPGWFARLGDRVLPDRSRRRRD